MARSYAPEVCVSGTWSRNGQRFATEAEAVAAGEELLSRWYVPTDSRATPTDDPVTYRFADGRAIMLSDDERTALAPT